MADPEPGAGAVTRTGLSALALPPLLGALLHLAGPGSAGAAPHRPGSDPSCSSLAATDPGLLREVATRVEERLAAALRDAELAGPGQTGYLEEVARAAAADLHFLLGEVPALGHLGREPVLGPAQLEGAVADLFLLTGRPELAAEGYRRAAAASLAEPDSGVETLGVETLCGASHGGRLYTAELWRGRRGRLRLGDHLLAREPESARVVERILLPGVPGGFRVAAGALEVRSGPAPRGPWTMRLFRGRRSFPVWVAGGVYPVDRFRTLDAGWFLADNFVHGDGRWRSPTFEPRKEPRADLPADLAELEIALRTARRNDPTQPWHLFFLGQCLWAQDRRPEATAVWEELLALGFPATQYYEWAWMAQSFELYGQPEWADAAFRRALEHRRRLPRPVGRSTSAEREVDAPFVKNWSGRPPGVDPERAHLWWQRARELTGLAPGDGFRAVLWAHHFERLGDRERADAERAVLAAARREPWPWGFLAWVDYALWLTYGTLAGLLFAVLAVLGGSVRPVLSWHSLRIVLGAVCVPLLAVGLASIALLLAIDLANHVYAIPIGASDAFAVGGYELRYADQAPPEQRLEAALASHAIGDRERARRLYRSLPETPRQEHLLAALERGLPPWIPEPPRPAPRLGPADLSKIWRDHRSWDLRRTPQLLHWTVEDPLPKILRETSERAGLPPLEPRHRYLASAIGLALLAVLVLRGWLGPLCRLLIPGTRALRRGHPLRAHLTFTLFAIAAGPSLWLLTALPTGLPSPGWFSSEAPLPGPDELILPPLLHDQLTAESFWSLLWVHPGARLFYCLVVLSLVASLYLHGRGTRKPSPGSLF
jgi:hypothetical protein